MKIKSLFDNLNDIEISEFLLRCGVNNPIQYLKAKTVEDTIKYDNIDEARDLILKYTRGGDANVN